MNYYSASFATPKMFWLPPYSLGVTPKDEGRRTKAHAWNHPGSWKTKARARTYSLLSACRIYI
jgi:hypothetical protein